MPLPRLRHFFPTLLLAALAPVMAAEEIITRAADLHELTREETIQPQQVRIRGVITYFRDSHYGDFVVQDESGGFIADLGGPLLETQPLMPGQQVEISGYTIIDPPPTPRVRVTELVLGPVVGLPPHAALTPLQILDGAGWLSAVTFKGVIQEAHVDRTLNPPRLILKMGANEEALQIYLARFDDAAIARLQPDALVEVRGVSMGWTNANLQRLRTFVVVHDPTGIDVLDPPVPLENLELEPISKVASSRPRGFTARRVGVRATATLVQPGELVVLQSHDSAIRTLPRHFPELQPGDEVSAYGFPGIVEGQVVLHETHFSDVSRAILPEAEPLRVRELLEETSLLDRDARRIRLTGELKQIFWRGREQVLEMEQDDRTFKAILPADQELPENLEPGSVLQLTGVCRLIYAGRAREVSAVELQLQDSRSIEVLARPSWWTEERVAPLLTAGSLLLGLILFWALILRRRVAHRTSLLIQEIRARHDSQLVAAERARLAADLHDTLSQTLSGAALQLEVAESLNGKPEAERHRALAQKLLDRSRYDLRSAVWDLTPDALLKRDLAAALKAVAEELDSDSPLHVEVIAAENLPSLPERARSHLFRVCQEAIHNAIRHSGASRIEISLTHVDGHLTATIADNGHGFDPDRVPGPSQGHLGLSSMRDRLLRLGGTLGISSSSDGTRVTATVPAHEPKPPGT